MKHELWSKPVPLRRDFMAIGDAFTHVARIRDREPMYSVSAKLLAQAIQMLDEGYMAKGHPPMDDTEISTFTGHYKITRTEIVAHIDQDKPVMVPADFMAEMGNLVLESGKTLLQDDPDRAKKLEPFKKLRLELIAAYLEGKMDGDTIRHKGYAAFKLAANLT